MASDLTDSCSPPERFPSDQDRSLVKKSRQTKDLEQPKAALSDGTALAVARGTLRLFFRHDMSGILEVPLPNGRRADIMALDGAGRITIVEIKCSRADLLGDMKWPDYFDYCDRYFWAVPSGFDLSLFESEALWPGRTGLIVADQYDAELVRPAPMEPLAAARRKAETLRFARRAARRLTALADPDHAAELGW